jgi:hypothetical protein
MPTQTFNASDTWTAPDGVTLVQVECWGPGGNGGTFVPAIPDDPGTKEDESVPAINGFGGGGGAYAKANAAVVVPSNVYTINVGTPNVSDTSFFLTGPGDTAALAKRGSNGVSGAAGAGGQASGCIGDVVTSGANGSGLTGGASPNGGAGGAVHTNGTAPGGGGGGANTTASPGTGAAGRITLTWEDPEPPPPDPIPARNQIIIIGH